MKKECGYCKHFAQGKTCSFCANPQQKDSAYKSYCYYNFSCSLFEQGIHQSRVDYTEKQGIWKTLILDKDFTVLEDQPQQLDLPKAGPQQKLLIWPIKP